MSRDLLHEIDVFLAERKIGDHRFGVLAINNGRLLERLRSGGRIWPETADKVRRFMDIERQIISAKKVNSPASSSVGDDAGASVTPPAQDGAPAEVSSSHAIKGACETGAQQRAETALRPDNHSNSPDYLPSGEAVARCEVRPRATATNSGEVVR